MGSSTRQLIVVIAIRLLLTLNSIRISDEFASLGVELVSCQITSIELCGSEELAMTVHTSRTS
jgi:hypothetical protein